MPLFYSVGRVLIHRPNSQIQLQHVQQLLEGRGCVCLSSQQCGYTHIRLQLSQLIYAQNPIWPWMFKTVSQLYFSLSTTTIHTQLQSMQKLSHTILCIYSLWHRRIQHSQPLETFQCLCPSKLGSSSAALPL